MTTFSLARLAILFLSLLTSCHGNEGEVVNSNGCRGTGLDVKAVVNATLDNMANDIILNCLSYSDAYTIQSGVVSWSMGSETGRYSVLCYDGVLVLSPSSENYTNDIIGCSVCEDEEPLQCPNDAECSDMCQQCYGTMASQCVMCRYAEYNSSCLSMCPGVTTPNEFNVCGCPNYFTGTDCSTCGLVLGDCESTYYINMTSCDCQVCPEGFVLSLLDPYATVPADVIGEPEGLGGEGSEGGGEGGHERRRRSKRQEGTGGEEPVSEQTVCLRQCPSGWVIDRTERNGICYACGLSYCLECNSLVNECTRCRNGTLLNIHNECEGFYEVIKELAEELEAEVEHERETLASHQRDLVIGLPIVCAFVVLIFFGFAIFAHFRYPHVGHEKRHRKPNKTTHVTDTERSFRPQSTVRFR